MDVGYAYAEPFERAGIEALPIATIENKVVVPKTHPLAKLPIVNLRQLRGMDCICLPQDVSPQLFCTMKQLASQYDFNIITRSDIRNFYNQVAYGESQYSAAIVASPACELISKNLRAISIEGSPLLKLVRMTRSDISQRFKKRLRELEIVYLEKLPGARAIPGEV